MSTISGIVHADRDIPSRLKISSNKSERLKHFRLSTSGNRTPALPGIAVRKVSSVLDLKKLLMATTWICQRQMTGDQMFALGDNSNFGTILLILSRSSGIQTFGGGPGGATASTRPRVSHRASLGRRLITTLATLRTCVSRCTMERGLHSAELWRAIASSAGRWRLSAVSLAVADSHKAQQGRENS